MDEYIGSITEVIDKKTVQTIRPTDADTYQEWSTDKLEEGIDAENHPKVDPSIPDNQEHRHICKVFSIIIPPGANYEIHTANMNGVGTAGQKNELILDTIN